MHHLLRRKTWLLAIVMLPTILFYIISDTLSWRPRILKHFGPVWSVAFSPDGRTIVSSSGYNVKPSEVSLWDVTNGSLIYTLLKSDPIIRSVAFSHDGRTLAVASDGEAATLIDATTGVVKRVLSQEPKWANSHPVTATPTIRSVTVGPPVAFSPDDRVVATGGREGNSDHDVLAKVMLWNAQTGTLLKRLAPCGDMVWAICFAPDGKALAYQGSDDLIVLWNMNAGRLVRTFPCRGVGCIAFSPDGRYIIGGSDNNKLCLWSTQTGKLSWTRKGYVGAVAYSPSGELIASGGRGQIKLWDAKTGRLMRVLWRHNQPVTTLAFSPDGAILASGSHDGSLKLWRVL